jgi:plasmid stabilization system protein ParE
VKLRFTPRAIADIELIYSYIEQRSARGATNVVSRIRDKAELLALWPDVGQPTNMGKILKQAIG